MRSFCFESLLLADDVRRVLGAGVEEKWAVLSWNWEWHTTGTSPSTGLYAPPSTTKYNKNNAICP